MGWKTVPDILSAERGDQDAPRAYRSTRTCLCRAAACRRALISTPLRTRPQSGLTEASYNKRIREQSGLTEASYNKRIGPQSGLGEASYNTGSALAKNGRRYLPIGLKR